MKSGGVHYEGLKMRLASISIAVVALIAGAAPSMAASIAGDTINVSYYYPDNGTLFYNAGDYVVPASGIDTFDAGYEFASLSANAITLNFGTSGTFTSASFNGPVFTDLSGPDITTVTIDPSTNLVGLTPADLMFTSTSVSLNTQGLSFSSDTIVKLDVDVAGVPLPASAPMFGAGLLALGAAGYAAKRKKAASAA